MKYTFSIPSHANNATISLYIWTTKQPVATVQLIHGMAEYAERYEPFIHFLNKHNINVIAHDHLGHGNSTFQGKSTYGFFAKKDAPLHLIHDVYHVANIAKTAYPDLPLIAIGHSMGSFILRNVIEKFPSLYKGIILMGSGEAPKQLTLGLPLTKFLNQLVPMKKNYLLDIITFGGYGLHYHEPYDYHSWLSKSKVNRQQFKNDKKLGFTFTNNGFYTLFQLVKNANTSQWYHKFPKELPTLLISGNEDPIGQYGKGVKNIYQKLLNENIQDIQMKLYPNVRHEILNEAQSFRLVCTDILEWIYSKIKNRSI